jgi:hypothetical protein
MDTIRTANQDERVLDWAEQTYAGYLQPAGAATQVWNGYHFRYYPATQSYAGVKDGVVYYLGPALGPQIVPVATLAGFLARAQADGF